MERKTLKQDRGRCAPHPASLSFANAQKKVTKEKGFSPAEGITCAGISCWWRVAVDDEASAGGEEQLIRFHRLLTGNIEGAFNASAQFGWIYANQLWC